MGIDDEIKSAKAFEKADPLEELFDENAAFEAWITRFVHQSLTVPSVQAQEVKTYAFICEKELSVSVTKDINALCNNTIRYCVWNGKIYIPFDTEERSQSAPDFKTLLTDVYTATLYNRIQFYLLDNGYVMCGRCGFIYKVIH